MAAVNPSPSGFSYAQAARSRPVYPAPASATPAAPSATPSKVTSGPTTPATGTFADLTPGGNWADDVEASVGEGASEPAKAETEAGEGVPVKEGTVERAKSEDKNRNVASGVSSPDMLASSSSTTKDDDASSAPTNGSSETTWENKSQTSEPAWIAERNARQSSSQVSESTIKPEKKSKESPPPQPASPPKPVVLTEAPAPVFNPWQQRAEAFKVKAATQTTPTPVSATKSTSTTQALASSSSTENERPRTDSRKKAGPIAGFPRNNEQGAGAAAELKKPGGPQSKRTTDTRAQSFQSSKTSTEAGVSGDAVKLYPQARSSGPKRSTAPPPVKDQGSWPTPDLAQDNQRKESSEKDDQEKQNAESTPGNKLRKKKAEWEPIVVTPNIIWETQGIRTRESRGPPGSERGGRGGPRSRGGFRGGSNGSHGDRQNGRIGSEDDAVAIPARSGESIMTDRDNVPRPPRPAGVAGDEPLHNQDLEARSDRNTRGPHLAEHRAPGKATKAEVAPLEQPNVNGTAYYAEKTRTSSPKQFGPGMSGAKDEEGLPKPVPRRTSVGTQTTQEPQANGHPSGEPPIRLVPSESRKEGRSFEAREQGWSGASRGAGKRGGRGRGPGAARDFVNGHQSNHAYGNGDFAGAPPYAGVPSSPSAYQPSRGNHQYPYQQQGRGGWNRANPRSQSIPLDGLYSRFGGPYAQSQLPSMQTYVPGMYEYSGYPMSAMPYPPYVEPNLLLDMVAAQLEYYFSLENLLKDMFLRKHMDSQGFVFLDVVASFNRVKQLNAERSLLKAACFQSDNLEIRVGEDGKERLRKREGWEQFLLPMDQRAESAQSEGPKTLQRPEVPPLQNFGAMTYRGPGSAGFTGPQQRPDRRSHDVGHPTMNGNAPHFAGIPPVPKAADAETTNGEDTRDCAPKSPSRDRDGASSQRQSTEDQTDADAEPDAFPDDQAAVLTVLVKVNRQKVPPYHSAATRTFSNGSIDSRSIFGEMEKSLDQRQAPIVNGQAVVNGSLSPSTSRDASPHQGRSQERIGGADISIYWVKETNGSQAEGVQSGLTPEPYVQLRYKALEQRHHAATDTCPYDLDVLYHFWSHFLIRNFNSRMYAEFKYYAHEDAKIRHNFNGLQNLINFYAQALLSHNPIRDRLVKDYVELVRAESPKLEGAAYKQLRSTWRNGALNLKNRKKLSDLVEGPLKERLES